MNNKKMPGIGRKLGISKEEIRKINKQRRKEKIRTTLIGGIISIISLLSGYIIGKIREPKMEYRGYPYGMTGSSFYCGMGLMGIFGGLGSLYLLGNLYDKKKHKTMISILVLFFIVLSVMAVIFGHEVGRPVEYYSGAIGYGVYSKDTGGAKDE